MLMLICHINNCVKRCNINISTRPSAILERGSSHSPVNFFSGANCACVCHFFYAYATSVNFVMLMLMSQCKPGLIYMRHQLSDFCLT